MRATECSFEELRIMSCRRPTLSVLLSYIQVEHGIHELQASWDGFTESSAYYGEEFSDKWEVCLGFERALHDFYDVGEPVPFQMGR